MLFDFSETAASQYHHQPSQSLSSRARHYMKPINLTIKLPVMVVKLGDMEVGQSCQVAGARRGRAKQSCKQLRPILGGS
jgi:hypothetical protein